MGKRIIAIIIGLALISAIAVVGQIFNIDKIVVNFSENTDEYTEKEISDMCGIKVGENILSLRDEYAKQSLNNELKTGRLQLKSIDRVYPNKVIINIDVLKPMFLVHKSDGKVIPTDADFKIQEVVENSESYKDLIDIVGIEIENSLNINELKFVRSLTYAFYNNDFDDSGFFTLVSEIKFDAEKKYVYVKLRNFSNVSFKIDVAANNTNSTLLSTVKSKLESFYNINEIDRHDLTI